jgi:hypothetical protein
MKLLCFLSVFSGGIFDQGRENEFMPVPIVETRFPAHEMNVPAFPNGNRFARGVFDAMEMIGVICQCDDAVDMATAGRYRRAGHPRETMVVGFFSFLREPCAPQKFMDMLAFPFAAVPATHPAEAASVFVPNPTPFVSVPFVVVLIHTYLLLLL